MTKGTKTFTLIAVLILFVSTGCMHAPGGVAPSTTPLEGRQYVVLGSASGSDSNIALLGILPITSSNDIRDAIEDALKPSGGDALINVTVENVHRYWILWSNHKTIVYGDAIKFK